MMTGKCCQRCIPDFICVYWTIRCRVYCLKSAKKILDFLRNYDNNSVFSNSVFTYKKVTKITYPVATGHF